MLRFSQVPRLSLLSLRFTKIIAAQHRNLSANDHACGTSKKPKSLLDSLKNVMKPGNNMPELLDKKKDVNTSLPENFEEEEEEWVEMFNKETGEWNGPRYGEPTKFGDWQSKGRTTDFH